MSVLEDMRVLVDIWILQDMWALEDVDSGGRGIWRMQILEDVDSSGHVGSGGHAATQDTLPGLGITRQQDCPTAGPLTSSGRPQGREEAH